MKANVRIWETQSPPQVENYIFFSPHVEKSSNAANCEDIMIQEKFFTADISKTKVL